MKQQLSLEAFHERTGLSLDGFQANVDRVVPMRDIVKIVKLEVMPIEYLEKLLRNVTLEGNPTIFPYRDAIIEQARMDPHMLRIGQTFAERRKYQALIENLSNLFGTFCTNRGFAKCTPLIVFGHTADNVLAIAHYLTPIIEYHDSQACLIDGIHRNYLTMSIGTTIESILIRNATPPPCDFGKWDEINIVDIKPSRELRFRNLNTALFRNLGWCGIDG